MRNASVGLMGASTGAYVQRIDGFGGAVKNYQAALMNYRQAVATKSPTQMGMKYKAQAAFQKMQSQFQNELNVIAGQTKSRRGTPLTNVDRGTNIAKSSRSAAKLNVSSHVEAAKLVKFTKYAKFLGNGLALIELGSGIVNVQSTYREEGNWERDLFIESSSFAASGITGMAVVNVGGSALGILMVATPVGWVGLIVGGLAVAGMTAAVSMTAGGIVKDNSGAWYDSIMAGLK